MLKIDRHTTMDEFAVYEPHLAEGEARRIKDAAVRAVFGADGFYTMTIDDLLTAMAGDVSVLHADATVFGVYRVKAFSEFVDTFIAELEQLTLPLTAEQMKNQQGTKTCTFDEAVYMFCRSFFGLRGYGEVDALKVADLLLAKKEAFNAAVVERNIAQSIKRGGKP